MVSLLVFAATALFVFFVIAAAAALYIATFFSKPNEDETTSADSFFHSPDFVDIDWAKDVRSITTEEAMARTSRSHL